MGNRIAIENKTITAAWTMRIFLGMSSRLTSLSETMTRSVGKDPADQILINRCSESEVDPSAIWGHPHAELRFFISTTARIKSRDEPLGPGFVRKKPFLLLGTEVDIAQRVE